MTKHTRTPQDVSHLISEASRQSGKLVDHPRSFSSASEIKDFYQAYGYITLKNAVPADLLAAIRSDLTAIFGEYSINKDHPVDSAIINLDKSDKQKLYELHTASSKCVSFKGTSTFFSELLKSISGSDAPVLEIGAGWLLSIAYDKRLVYDFHQESNYMKGFGDIFNVHYPLFRTSTLENGTMSILPGSHRYGTLSFNKNRVSNDSYTDLIPINIDEIIKELPELHCYLELGDVCIFHKDLIHKSNFNGSSLCRPVGVSRFTQSIKGDWVNRKPDEL
jgi:Phytanoyl-CoA dioxygenase (PhyH)